MICWIMTTRIINMTYKEMKNGYIKGWRTWNVRSVLSHVHMPDGFALNIAFEWYYGRCLSVRRQMAHRRL